MPAADDVRAQISWLHERAAEARRRAAAAEARAAVFEEKAAVLPAPLGRECLRMAALQRQVQTRQLASARLQDQFADRLRIWVARPSRPGRRPVFMDAVAAAIGMSSAAVILLGARRDEAVIAASDATARAAYDLEFVLGEGPAHLAVTSDRRVQVAGAGLHERWPQFGSAVTTLGVHAVLAVPLPRPAGPGVVCAYGRRPAIGEQAAIAAGRIADALPLALSHAVHDGRPGDGVPALRLLGEADVPAVVHQAAGMVSLQCGCEIADALALVRARAFSTGRSAGQVAAGIVSGDLRLC